MLHCTPRHLGVMAAPGLLLWSLGQVKTFWRMHGQTIERSEGIIWGWLDRTGLNVRTEPLPVLTFYRYIVTQSYCTVAVLKSRDDPDVVTLSVNLNPLPQDETILYKLTGPKDSTLIDDLVIEFARLGIEYQGLQHPIC